jgi:DNA invertase Pin-like site-specific DNA recombinase
MNTKATKMVRKAQKVQRIAFSYIRFSTPEQARGDSFRRQTEKAEAWAKANGYTIKKSLKDLGVSSYRGKNAETGKFGEFLRAAEAGELPKDSVLLVENLDRVSRQAPRKALRQFLEVLELGIGVVTLTDGQLYSATSVDDDTTGMKLFASLMVMIRANNESRVKGERVAAAWAKKRERARENSLALSDRIPGWLKPVRDAAGLRTFTKNDERVKIVRRIFEETAKGLGRRAIVKGLNGEGEKSFLTKKAWQPSSVAKVIHSRAVLGEYQPHRRDKVGRLIPDGEVIKGYYPAVVDEALWIEANDAVKSRRANAAGRPHAQVGNLVRGLVRCGCCKERMLFLNKGKPPKGGCYYVCSEAARHGEKCDNRRLWSAKDVERWLVHQLNPAAIAITFEPAPKRSGRTQKSYDAEIAELTAMNDAAQEVMLRRVGTPMALQMESKSDTLIARIKELERIRDEAAAKEQSKPRLPATRTAIATVAALGAKLETSNAKEKVDIRNALVQQLRIAFAEIRFWPHEILGLIELPNPPKSMKGPFGIPRAIEVVKSDDIERYFYRHRIFSDDPAEMAEFDGGKGVRNARFTGYA